MAKKEFYYEHIMNEIAVRIEDGGYKYMEQLPPERTIAEEYQVNRTTVRRALSLLVEKGYIEKQQGAGSRVVYKNIEEPCECEERKERTIGFFLPGGRSKDIRFEQPFYMTIYYYLELFCRKHNYRVMCITITDLDDFISLIQEYHFCGAFFMSKIRKDIVEYAMKSGIPSVAVNEKFAGMPCITMDNVNGGYLATKYLLDKGHRQIAFVTGPDRYFTSEDRMLGVKKVMDEYGVPLKPENIAKADWTFDGGYTAVWELLGRSEGFEEPTALFVFNEEMTHGVMKALQEKELRVPEDISVIGFENTSDTVYSDSITMIDGNIKLVAKTAATTLLNKIDGCGLDFETVILLPVSMNEAKSVKEL